MNPSHRWQDCFEEIVNEVYFHQFKQAAEALTVTALRAENRQQAAKLVVGQIEDLKVRSIASIPMDLLGDHVTAIGKYAASADIDFTMAADRQIIEQADMGISQFQMGVSQLGSIFQDSSSLHSRLLSMLPPIHLALLPTNALVKSFADALQLIDHVYKKAMPPYLSFITGPSKTADIERQLTIGVHGPAKLIVLCIDPE